MIRTKDLYITSSYDLEEVLGVYRRCLACNWEYDELLRIKEDVRKHHYKDFGIVYSKGKYLIFKYGNKTQIYYGRYSTLEEAEEMITRIRLEGIDPVRRRGCYRRRGRLRYVHRNATGSWSVVHGGESFGTYRCLDDALLERDLLESVDWDWDALDGLEVNWDEEEDDEEEGEEEVGQSKKTR